tara:strand:- start:1099 stop:1203 length:105 start_codon:yes stop_codon:yes gene_type:complete
MKIIILGAGGIGSLVGGLLSWVRNIRLSVLLMKA